MLENCFIEKMMMSGELVRVVVAVIGTAIASWYDIKNNKNVPNNLLYAFLAIAFAVNLVFFQYDVFVYSVFVAAIIFLFGYFFYRMGYIGGADIYVLTSIALLVPIFPSYTNVSLNIPIVFSIIILSGVFFALYFIYFISQNIILKRIKGKFEYLLLAPIYAILIYFIYSVGIFGPVYLITLSVLIISLILFMIYKERIMECMARKIPISKVDEEEIAVLELMPSLVKEHNIKRLLDAKELERLKQLKIKEIYVYTKLPPFLPFILLGLIISVIIGDVFMLMLT